MKYRGWCLHCGKPFLSDRSKRMFCTRAHQMAAWRAVKMLEGTYGWVNGRFVPLPLPERVAA